MSYPRLAQRLYNQPLVITSDKLEIIERVFRMHETGTLSSAKLVQPYEAPPRPEVAAPGEAQYTRAGYLRTADGLAIVSVLGTLVQRGSGMDAMSGLASYEKIAAQLSAAVDDPQVRGVLLEVDSPGGEVPGVFDLGNMIRDLADVKPIVAHANEMALSGGYVLASAADEVYAPKTGLVGSIGVRMAHIDQSGYDQKRGVVYTEITAGARKGDFNPHAPLSDEALRWAQEHVNHTYEIFVDHVARMRGLDPEAVKATEAGVFHAEQGVAMGLIDGVATAGETLGILRTRIESRERGESPMRMAANAGRTFQPSAEAETGAEDMADTKQPTAPSADDLAQAQARGFQQGKQEAESSLQEQLRSASEAAAKLGAKAAQERIRAILTHAEAEGRRTLAEHFAYETDDSVEKVTAALAKAPKEAAAAPVNVLDAKMRGTNPKVGADTPKDGGGDEETEEAVAARIVGSPVTRKPRLVK